MRLIVVSGLAGSGKTVALNMLEDLGYYCIDNLPMELLRDASVATLNRQGMAFERMAVGIDARARHEELAAFGDRLKHLRSSGVDARVFYLEASDEVILKRYSETRRKHPLTNDTTPLAEAVAADRKLLKPIASQADVRFDTSDTNVHQLRDFIRNNVEAEASGKLSVLVQSFGFKYGVPRAVDFVFDVRCLPNPHWVPELRPYTGKEQPVIDHLAERPETERMLNDINTFMTNWLPEFARENRAYVTIAIGCTGGRHRSVYLAEQLAQRLQNSDYRVLVHHNELP